VLQLRPITQCDLLPGSRSGDLLQRAEWRDHVLPVGQQLLLRFFHEHVHLLSIRDALLSEL
jgi:hypothetical protein